MNKRLVCVFFLLSLLFLSGCSYKNAGKLDNTKPDLPQETEELSEQVKVEACQELELCGVVDKYDSADKMKALFEGGNSLEKMAAFNQTLNSQFEFYEIYEQPLQSRFYWNMDDSFLDTYNGAPIKNQELEIEGEDCFVSTLNGIQVNQKAYNYFLDYIEAGRGFCESDFQYKRNSKIPVILGNDYKMYYSIGDIIELDYLLEEFNFEVIGFFEQGLELKIMNSKYNMDKYLCVPFLEYDGKADEDDERAFWIRCYQQKNSGYIKIDTTKDQSEEEIVAFYGAEIQKIAEKFGLQYSALAIIYRISGGLNHDGGQQ